MKQTDESLAEGTTFGQVATLHWRRTFDKVAVPVPRFRSALPTPIHFFLSM